MITIKSEYDKDTMTDTVTVSDGFKYICLYCPHSMTMEDYCSALETAVNRMNGHL